MTRLDCAELRKLLDALCEESCTPAQMARIEELVLNDPEAEAYYVQYMAMQADLAGHFRAVPRPKSLLPDDRRDKMARSARPLRAGRLFWFGVALSPVAAGLLLVMTLLRNPDTEVPAPPPEASDDSVAVMLYSRDAHWGDSDSPTRPGAPMRPGWLRLKSGFAHIEFYSGATVILEGPAELKLISRSEAYCSLGKLWATVPPQAHGFTIGAPTLDLVDRGTEFGLHVGAGNRTEVHVFKGIVDLYDSGADRDAAALQELKTGEGVRRDGPGAMAAIEASPTAFKTAQDLGKEIEAELARCQKAWQEAGAALQQDPSLEIYYTFQAEPTGSRTLLDSAQVRKQPRDGVIVGCSWVAGRWPGRQALEFKKVGDRVRLHVPGEFDTLTLMAWVRVDSLLNRFNALLMTDSWEEAAPHWHISNRGRLELGVQGFNRKGGVHYLTEPIVTPDRLGEWIHVAVVYDRPGETVTHYVDGQPVQHDTLKLDIRLRLGDCELGNWNIKSRPHTNPIRNFSGCIDEFMLFSRALPDAEIERIFTQSRPPS